jgi:hypothetical protein
MRLAKSCIDPVSCSDAFMGYVPHSTPKRAHGAVDPVETYVVLPHDFDCGSRRKRPHNSQSGMDLLWIPPVNLGSRFSLRLVKRLRLLVEDLCDSDLFCFLLFYCLFCGGFVFFHVAGFLIHLLLLFAIISLVAHFFIGSRTA